MPTVFRLLGPVEAVVGGRPVGLGAPKQRALLAELLLRRGDVVPRTRLIDSLWGEAPPEAAAASLQVYVHGLRRVLGADRIETRGTGYRIRLEPGELDLERFELLAQRGAKALHAGQPAGAAEDLRAALALRLGEPLADLREQPVGSAAVALEDRIAEAVELLAEAELALGRHEALLPELDRAVADHPYRERLREHQILALYRSGRHADALAAYQEARRAFDELGIEPGLALRELERAVLRHDDALAAPDPPGPPVLRLPQPPTELVGRRLEVAAVTAMLRRDDVRLVTLTGAGGTGKTRLAIAAAVELADELTDGAAFVDLAPVTDAALVASTIAQSLGLETETVDGLARELGGRSILLVVDNFEQVLDGATVVARLLAEAPRLRVIATSRAPLRLRGEHEYPVPALPTPPRSLPTFEEVADNDAVRLFVARARAVDPTFVLTDANLAHVAAITRALDGLPLAIELAAARTRALSVEAIASRLGRSLDLLSGGARDLPERQRTLRATLDWSFNLLAEEEQALLAQLAVFSGGCRLAALAAVVGAREEELLERLFVLVDGNLVQRLAQGPVPRFGMLETIRAYAFEHLEMRGELGRTRDLHARYFLARAEDAGAQLFAATSETLLDELDDEHDNFRAAFATFEEAGDAGARARLAFALRWFWVLRGHVNEGRAVFDRVIDEMPPDSSLRAAALAYGATFPYRQGDTTRAKALWEEALGLYEGLGDLDGVSRCKAELAAVSISEGDLDAAADGYVEAARLFEQLGNRSRLAVALSNLGEIETMRGDLVAAARCGERAVALQEELGERDGLAMSQQNLARVHMALGDYTAAEELLRATLAAAHRLGYRELLGYAFATAGELAFDIGDLERAALLIGVSEEILRSSGAELQGPERAGYDRALASLAETLGEAQVSGLRAEGRRASLDRMIAAATRATAK